MSLSPDSSRRPGLSRGLASLWKRPKDNGDPDPVNGDDDLGQEAGGVSGVTHETKPISVGDAAPDFVLPAERGERRSLSEIITAGPALLVFFKTTCKSSRIAIALYAELERRYGDVVPVVAIAQDPLEAAETWLAGELFSGHMLTDFPSYDVSAKYGLLGLPTAVLVNRDGTVLESLVGWSRDAVNALAARMGRMTARDERAVSSPNDGRIAFRPG